MQLNRNLTVNFHFASFCNMKCKYCFVEKAGSYSLEEYFQVIEKLAKFFSRINFVGGEPTTSPYLIPLVRKAKSVGLECSMVTNGFELIHHENKYQELFTLLSSIGISVDSLDDKTNNKIGRKCGHHIISRNEYEKLCKTIKAHGIKLKINTVVSKLNLDEDFSKFYKSINPDRIKLFQVLKPNNQLKQNYDDLLVSQEEFTQFIKKQSANVQIVVENNDAMTNAYYILNSECQFLDNKTGIKSPSLVNNSLSVEEALSYIGFDYKKYSARYCA